ncbi:hypothetical protein ACOSQ3_006747 [Xanthoceras sorbifolium]
MDFEDLESLCASLSLKEEAAAMMPIDRNLLVQGQNKVALCLVGKFLVNKLVNREVFRSPISKIWKITQGVEIEVIQDNIYAFHFHNQSDRIRVLVSDPWNFDNAILILQEPKWAGELASVDFRVAEFWVQIHHIPLLCMTKDIERFLGSLVGKVSEVDGGASGDCLGRYLRVRVGIDVTQPLKRCLKVDVEGTGTATIMSLRYELLPGSCSSCGKLEHLFRECVGGKTASGW